MPKEAVSVTYFIEMIFLLCPDLHFIKENGSVEFFNTIVLQPHLKLVTDLGRGYHVRCRYKSQEDATPSNNVNRQVNAEALISDEVTDRRGYGRSLGGNANANKIPMPSCHMKIMSGDHVAENVKIGDPLTLNVIMDKQDKYGLHVTDCTVRDGLGWGEQKLVNNKGFVFRINYQFNIFFNNLEFDRCPVDGEIMGTFDYNDDRTLASVSFPAHKFPYTASVYYQCNVKFCNLKDAQCHKVNELF